ncbi:hypothetical protein BC939DRAFT_532978 [Gamsiella multidivaricata]|uniref:uncharacterized protein n=1 Tax=Gamsiella multidivaricata TaxID=101098 RepID=UPI0022201912|nr:uncharacterized protein BC939DRAFT_532978 [Gamsiella multidivaricata]KAG0370141.1 hypothetical protein BGZ54_007571 [Gamsiella multidivaricata]KAI7817187.1 hypothetical protein BC939DRAFT_532978 [Gamsiella multidivaricata]
MASTQSTNASVSTFLSSVIFTTAVSAGLFVAFALVRTRFPRVYAPKTYIGPQRERVNGSVGGILGWVFGSPKQGELDFIQHCGLDAFMFLEFLNKSFFLFLGFSFLAIPVLIPLNSSNQLGLAGLNQLTIANIADQQRLWAHVVMTVLFCGATIALGVYTIRQYIIRRQNYLMSDQHTQTLQATTILVCGVPKGENDIQNLHNIFGTFSGGVRRIWLAYAATDLEKDISKRVNITNKLEAAECKLIKLKLKHHLKRGRRGSYSSTNPLSGESGDNHQQDQRQHQQESSNPHGSFPQESRPRHRPAKFPMSLFASCCGAEKVDSIQTYRSELSSMNSSILARQQAGMAAMHDGVAKGRMRAAFIQFNHQLGAHLAAQSVIHRKILTMGPRHLEVHPKDVLWDNLNLGLKTRTIRRTITASLAAALILTWAIPVAFVASIAKLDAIVEFAPFLSGVYSLPTFVVGIIQGILPPIGLALLMMLLPIILYRLAHYGGEVLSTRKTLSVVTSYHWFSVVHVLLVTTLANGIFAAVEAIKENPNNIMTMLASTLPQASTFFLTFILTSLIHVPMMLLQIGPLITYILKKKLTSTPRKMFATETNMGSVDWGMTIPVHTIAFSIGLLYSTIQPIILPFMVIYFGLNYLAFRYMFLYVYRQPFDSGGLIFPRIVDQIYIGVIIFELVMLGLFIIQKAIGQSIVAFILLVASLTTIIISRNRVFKPLIQYLPVEAFDTRNLRVAMGGSHLDAPSASGMPDGSVNSTSRTRALAAPAGATAVNVDDTASEQASITEKINPIPAQESFQEKVPYKDPSSPQLGPETRELYIPDLPNSSGVDTSVPESGRRRQGSAVLPRSQYSNQSPLPSIRIEDTTEYSPSTATPAKAPSAPSHHGLSVRQGPDYDGVDASSSLQVLGANNSLLSVSDPASEKVVPDTFSYVNPAFWVQGMPIWLPKDPRGFVELETVELNNAGLPSTTDSAAMDMKGRITVDTSKRELAPGEEHWEAI